MFVTMSSLIELTQNVLSAYFVASFVTAAAATATFWILFPSWVYGDGKTRTKKLLPKAPDSLVACVSKMTSIRVPMEVLEWTRTVGPDIRISMPQIAPFCIVTSPKLVKIIFEGDPSANPKIKAWGKPRHIYKLFEPLTCGHPSVFTKMTEGEGWDWARKGCAPSFSQTNLLKRLSLMQSKANEFCDIVETDYVATGSQLTDISDWLVSLTIDFIAVGMFGTDFQLLKGEAAPDASKAFLRKLPAALKEIAMKQIFDPSRKYQFWVKEVREAADLCKDIFQFAHDVLAKYRSSPPPDEDGSSILANLIKSPHPSEDARAADVLVMLVAGHDTSAYQLSLILIEIVKHPDVLRKLEEELDRALPNRDNNFSPDALTELTYLNCVINEGMRLQPVGAQGSVREAPCDIEYEDKVIPKGSTVLISTYAMHRSHAIRSPDEFIPERWLKDDPELDTLKSLFYPFAAGKRNCVGQNLAMLELRMFIATLFRRFNFELVSKVSYEFNLVLRPVNANFKVTRRF